MLIEEPGAAADILPTKDNIIKVSSSDIAALPTFTDVAKLQDPYWCLFEMSYYHN